MLRHDGTLHERYVSLDYESPKFDGTQDQASEHFAIRAWRMFGWLLGTVPGWAVDEELRTLRYVLPNAIRRDRNALCVQESGSLQRQRAVSTASRYCLGSKASGGSLTSH